MQRKFISRRSFLKCAGVGAVAAAGLLAGGGGSDSSSSTAASTASSAAAEPADPNKPYAGVTLYYAATDTEATGPELHIRDDALHVACSPVEKIYVVTSGRRCLMQLAAPGQSLTEAVFPLHGDEGYIRVDCRDGQGRHAYSNAYWLDE